jgi:phosphatidylglycerophosphatase A
MNMMKKTKLKNGLIKFGATGFYTGFLPYFPGTVGSSAALVLAWFWRFSLWQILLLVIIGVYLCTKAEMLFKQHDSPKIVFDEFCGIFVAVWGLTTLHQFLLGFLFFRLLDIAKPFPINKLQALPRGWGVMADDLLAGALARLILAIFF